MSTASCVEPPYVIDVIGDPHTLAGGLDFPEGPIDQLEDDGAEVEVEELDSLDIESRRRPRAPGVRRARSTHVAGGSLPAHHAEPTATEETPCTPTT